ncbi:tRNA uridine(34) 5-carboxymethylaminomethyl modification radical SAM/GNAT enzyme Elp3 [archaeon]|nr:tRNA uridine(34) 5-carboxymethylaminomethyl modification radical SAM/GNAT enzyme Elp3 [archaeon]MBT6698766.1 tRNA uridine(34) 5-carboxymethylaminomethyl modification radical SAM/GNAT enzyme Elp3 [archaeon]
MGNNQKNNLKSDRKYGAQALVNAEDAFYVELVSTLISGDYTGKALSRLKKDLCQKYKLPKIPTNIEIYLRAPSKMRMEVRRKLMTKPVRSISGVSPIAIMTKPLSCPHGRCIYCPGGPDSVFGDVPQSYTGKEPASMRAMRNYYDAYLQVFNRIEQYVILGHNFEKNDVIIMGGTFPSFEIKYQDEFVTYMYKAMNDFSDFFYVGGENSKGFDFDKFIDYFELPGDIRDPDRTSRIQEKLLKLKLGFGGENGKGQTNLDFEKRKNDLNSYVKCIGLTIETKPDWALLPHAKQMLRLGCTRVELGVQTTNALITAKTNRGHTQEETIESIRVLKDLGFKLNFHMMPGLPGSSEEEDVKMLKEVVRDSRYMPDMMKIYPCMVMPGTPLLKLYKAGKFAPMETAGAIRVIKEFIAAGIPKWLRIMRVQRDIPTYRTEAGVDKTNLRQMLEQEMQKEGIKSSDIRAREAKGREVDYDAVELVVSEYEASGGKEYFISYEDRKNDILLGFIRLRFVGDSLCSEIDLNSALIRELHVYGQAVAIGDTNEGVVQHKGYGAKLLAKAEKIALENGKKKVVVISGVGVRGYYEKFGYEREGPYMSKKLNV